MFIVINETTKSFPHHYGIIAWVHSIYTAGIAMPVR